MNREDRAETIAMTLLWLGGIALFVWSWHLSGSFWAALLATVVGGFFLVVLAGPLVATAAFVLSLAADLIWPRR